MTRTRQFLFLFVIGILLPLPAVAINTLSVSLGTGSHDSGVFQDSLLYIASQRGIGIYSVRDPYAPSPAGSLDTPGICSHVLVENGILTVTDGTAIRSYSLADPVSPSPLAAYSSTRTFTGISARDSVIAVSTVPNGVTLLIRSGSSMDSVSRIPFNEAVTALLLSDTLLIVGLSNSGLTIYSIANPALPTLLLPPIPVQVNDLAVVDTILFCASGNSGVRIFTISDPSAPDTLSSYDPGDFIMSVIVTDTFLCCSGLMHNLYVADISDPAYPIHVHTFTTAAIPLGSSTDGEILYGAERNAGELFSLSLQTMYSSLEPLEPVTCTAISDSIAFVGVEGSGLAILDISFPQNPNVVSWYTPADTVEQVLLRDSLVFLSRGSAGFTILNVSDPGSPLHLSSYNTPGVLHGIAKKGPVLFLADGSSGMLAVSIDDPYTPAFLDSVMLPGFSQDIALADSLALVALGPKGFAMVSVKDPQNLVVIDTVTDAGYSTCIAASDTFLFLGTQDESILIYDFASWSTPQPVATYPARGPVNDLFYSNNLLFAASGEGGIQIVDVSDPYAPFGFDSLDTPGISSSLHPYLGLIATADRFGFRIDSFAFHDTIPPGPITNLSLEARDSLIVLRWHSPGDADYKGTRVVFRNDTFPVHPDDGTILLDHTMEPSSPDSLYHTGLPGDSTRFYYAVYAYDLADNFSLPALTSGISASDTIPPGEVSQISFVFWGHLLEVQFMTPNDADLLGVRAMFDTTHVPENIYDGTVFFDKPMYPNLSYAETLAVDHGRTYHFTFFAKDSVPNFSAGVSASFQTIDTIPPNEVTYQLVEFLNYRIRIIFRTPGDSDLVSVKACYDLVQPPQQPDSGTVFFFDSLNQNTSYLRELSGVTEDTTYYFTFFTRDTALNFSAGIACTCITNADTVPPDTVLQFSAQPVFPDTVKFSWVNPPDSDFYYVSIRYDTDTFPASPNSGSPVVNDGGQPAQPDSARWNPGKPGVNLFFSAFATDRWGNAAQGVHSWCPTPTLTRVQAYDPVDGGSATWLDTISITFTAPMQQPTLATGIELSGRNPYSFTVSRNTGATYSIVPPSLASLDTLVITLHNTILDSIGNPFDGNGDGIPDSVDDYSWTFFTGLIGDYVQDDTINAQDFAVLRAALTTQDLTKEVGPCSGSAPYYVLIPDSSVDFEDFAIFIMMWNWSLDTRGIPLIAAIDHDSLVRFEQRDTLLCVNTRRKEHLVGGEIIIHGIGSRTIERGAGMGQNDLFLAKEIDDDMLICFGVTGKMGDDQIATIGIPGPLESIDYSYRLVYADTMREGTGTCAISGLIPRTTLLQSVCPNPTMSITVSFGIPENMHVTLELYDTAGRKVATLLEKRLKAGYHAITVDDRTLRSTLAAGIYFVRLHTKDTSLVQKVILLR